MPYSRAYTSFLRKAIFSMQYCISSVSMPSRAYTSFLPGYAGYCNQLNSRVNALSGLYLISTPEREKDREMKDTTCQCPLGLIPHFYDNDVRLMIHYYQQRVNALSGLYLISTVPLQKPRFYAVSRVCFCRYLSEYSDNSRFSCMLTIWTYLMRCTYP